MQRFAGLLLIAMLILGSVASWAATPVAWTANTVPSSSAQVDETTAGQLPTEIAPGRVLLDVASQITQPGLGGGETWMVGAMTNRAPTGLQAGAPAAQTLLARLNQGTAGHARISYHAATGQIRFFGTDLDYPLRLEGISTQGNGSPEATARAFLSAYGSLFGIENQARELRVMRTRVVEGRRRFVRFQQIRDGIPVLAGELIVQVDERNAIISANGEVLPFSSVVDHSLSSEPQVRSVEAQAAAVAAVAKTYGIQTKELTASAPAMWVYYPVLLGAPGPEIAQRVWRMDVTSAQRADIRALVLIEAQRGFVALQFNQVNEALSRRIYDDDNDPTIGLPGTGPVRTEGQDATGRDQVDKAYEYAGDVYSYLWGSFGRDSLDGAGLPLVVTVRYCEPFQPCPYPNAFWNGAQMAFGDSFVVDDVMGHEMAHGVTTYESNLFYYMQSGAINESLSDVFGEFVDLTNGRGNDADAVRWLMGEDVPGGALRSMSSPPAYGDPDKLTSAKWYCGPSDQGGVHTNSGVNNKACFLMTDGGDFNGRTVTGLGIPKVGRIYYEAQTNLLTSGSDYQDLYSILIQACTNLSGTGSITPADVAQVTNAVQATEMDVPPTGACARAEAPVCSGTTNTAWLDDFESLVGRWTTAAFTGNSAWGYLQGTYATSGQFSLYGADQDTTSDSVSTMPTSVDLPAGAFLHFRHAWVFENGHDGGVVEYSTNGGSSWVDAGGLFTHNGYNGTLASGNPLSGRQAFTGQSYGYTSSRLNLASLAGQNVRFRFRIGTDSTIGAGGWFVDDVRIAYCTAVAIPAAPTGLAASKGTCTTRVSVNWNASARAADYKVYRNTSNASATSTQIGAATDVLYVDASAVPGVTYWYWVKASNDGGDSAFSNGDSGYRAAAPPCDGLTGEPKADCEALVALYNATGGAQWTNKANWLVGDPCTWYGVTCNGGRVTGLELPENGLRGAVPAELSALTNLRLLSLTSNQLTGPLPAELGNLTNLQELQLGRNPLTGRIPAELGNLTNLQYVVLEDAQLTGPIPPELGNLAQLREMWLCCNQLTSVPAELGNLANLRKLALNNSRLAGPIPAELGNLTKLEFLALGGNQLTGLVPAELGNLTSLRYLGMGVNQLTGPIPAALGSLARLNYLFLENNQLTGPIPAALGNLTNLLDLFLSSNRVTGSIPAALGNLTHLERLWLDNNQLTGPIPAELGNLSALKQMGLTSNALEGEVPISITALANLGGNPWGGNMELGYNKLRASNPAVRAFLDTNDPDWADTQTVPPTNVQASDVRATRLQLTWTPILYTWDGAYEVGLSPSASGPYTPVVTMTHRSAMGTVVSGLSPNTLYYLAVRSHTPASGYQQNALTSGWSREVTATMQSAEAVEGLEASDDSPTVLGQSTTLTATVTAGSQVTFTWALGDGTVAQGAVVTHTYAALGRHIAIVTASNTLNALTATTTVHIMSLSGERDALVALYDATDGAHWSNKANWPVGDPCTNAWYGVSCQGGHVIELSLNGNGLSGPIPAELGNLTRLVFLALGGNQLTGLVPAELGNLTSLRYLGMGVNQLTGPIPAALGSLARLNYLFLENNQLTGPIPAALGNLTNLLDLFLSSNRVTGSIPAALGNLTHLERLWLDNNQLTGPIPAELGNLSALKQMGLTGNALDDEVPISITALANLGGNPWGGNMELGYNKLRASNPAVRAFLDTNDPDWADTQTVPPTGLRVTGVAQGSLSLAWTPITYTADGGYYQVRYATTSGGPYTVHGVTSDKNATGYVASGLLPGRTYYWVVRTYTLAHGDQQNALWSANSVEVTVPLPPTGLALTGPASGITGASQAFGANVSPVSTTTPITYTWTATGLATVTHGGAGRSDSVSFTWPTAGTKTVGVTARNAAGQVVGSRSIVISLATWAPIKSWSTGFGTSTGWSTQDGFPRTLVDVNGDGKADVVGFGAAGTYVSLSSGTGLGALALWSPSFGSSVAAGSWVSQTIFPRMLGDVNGDGKADVVGFGGAGVYVALANAAGTAFGSMTKWSSSFGFLPAAGSWTTQETFPRALGDVNGDGKADIVGFGGAGVYVALATPVGAGVRATTSGPMRLWSPSFGYLPAAGSWVNQNTYPRLVGDVNGDGKADIVGFGAAGAYVALSTGTAFGPMSATPWVRAFGAAPAGGSWASQNLYPRTLADVNGDGKADIVGYGAAGAYYSLSTGSGLGGMTFGSAQLGAAPAAGGWTSQNAYPRFAADLNHDHKADLVGFGGAGVFVGTHY